MDDKVIKAMGAIYDSATEPDLWPFALEAIADCFDAAGTVLIMRQQDESLTTIVSPSLIDAQLAYEEKHWKTDFLAMRLLENSISSNRNCHTEQTLASPQEIATHPFFTDFRKTFGLGSAMSSVLMPHPQIPVVVAVQGHRDKPVFSEEEIELGEKLFEHVGKALTLSVRLFNAERRETAIAEILSRMACGIFILSKSGEVLFSNSKADDLIGQQIDIIDSVFQIKDQENDRMFKGYLSEDLEYLDEPVKPVILDSHQGKRTVLHCLPVGQNEESEVFKAFSLAHILVLAVEHTSADPLDPSLIKELLGLTMGEARLASLIASGKSPQDAAGDLSISVDTARTVLKRVFSKTGVSRQSELAALLSSTLLRI